MEIMEIALALDETPDEDEAAEPEAEIYDEPAETPDPTASPEADATPPPSSAEPFELGAQSPNLWLVVIPVALLALLIGGGAGFLITKKINLKNRKDESS